MRLRLFHPLTLFVTALALTALAFRSAPQAPSVLDETSFLPRTEAVQWMSLGHRSTAASLFWINGILAYGESFFTGQEYRWITHLADASTRLDTLFKTPYTFVAAITPVSQEDTSDFIVLRRGIAQYPRDWQLAVSFALRLAEGPIHDNLQASRIMKRFANDTTVLPYVRNIHRTLEIRGQSTPLALAMILDDCQDPRYTIFSGALGKKTARLLKLEGAQAQQAEQIVQKVVDKKLDALAAHAQLMALISPR